MILQRPEWGGEHAEDIWSLYYFLLYQVLPFEPRDYLPKDEQGYYYYCNGNCHSPRIYPQHPCNTVDDPPYKIIKPISAELCNYLFDNTGTTKRQHLRELLTTPTDENTIHLKHLDFALTSPTAKIRAQSEAWRPVLNKVFNYSSFSTHASFPKLIQSLGVDVCPYCNRSFTTTAKKNDESYHRQNQVDHYISKSTHPWFALSLLNLIPCCGSCNQKKGASSNFVLYPYFEEFGLLYRFRSEPISSLGYLTGGRSTEFDFHLVIEQVSGTVPETGYKKRVENSINEFGLDILYKESHNAFVSKIFEQRFLISNAYLDSLCCSFPDYFTSHEDVRSMLYLRSINTDKLGESPLAKLAHDIEWEIDDLNVF